jgi:hypothetical protein
MLTQTFHASYGKFDQLSFEASCDFPDSTYMNRLREHPLHLTRASQLEMRKRGLKQLNFQLGLWWYKFLCSSDLVLVHNNLDHSIENWLTRQWITWMTTDWTMKMTTFWDIAPCSLVEVCSRFRCLHCIWNVCLLQRDYTALYPRKLSLLAYIRRRENLKSQRTHMDWNVLWQVSKVKLFRYTIQAPRRRGRIAPIHS